MQEPYGLLVRSYWNVYLACKRQQLCGPVDYRDFREAGPWAPWQGVNSLGSENRIFTCEDVWVISTVPGGILGGGVPPGALNPDPISDQTMSFSTPAFRPGLSAETMLSLLRLERKQKLFVFLSYSFGIETINTSIRSPCFHTFP